MSDRDYMAEAARQELRAIENWGTNNPRNFKDPAKSAENLNVIREKAGLKSLDYEGPMKANQRELYNRLCVTLFEIGLVKNDLNRILIKLDEQGLEVGFQGTPALDTGKYLKANCVREALTEWAFQPGSIEATMACLADAGIFTNDTAEPKSYVNSAETIERTRRVFSETIGLTETQIDEIFDHLSGHDIFFVEYAFASPDKNVMFSTQDNRWLGIRDEIGTMPDSRRHALLQQLTWMISPEVMRQAIDEVTEA
jgi:hypothetical protein